MHNKIFCFILDNKLKDSLTLWINQLNKDDKD